MRVLAVDFGERRIGLAVSDPEGRFVVPVGAVERKSDAQAAAAVRAAAAEREVERIVVGLPASPGQEDGPFARRARNFARRLAEVTALPVDLHGEGLTSVSAERDLIDAGIPSSRRKGALDAEAAATLLRDYLDAQGSGRERGPGDGT